MSNDSPAQGLPLAVAMGGSAVFAAIAAGDTPSTTLAAGAAPLVVQAAAAVRAHWVKKSARAIEVAADHMGVGVDIVLERSLAYEDRLELLARVIEASARTTIAGKIDALGRVLADGLKDDGDTAEALLLATALEVLEGPHVVVLDFLERTPQAPPELVDASNRGMVGWQVPMLSQVLPDLANVLDPLVATLSGAGLIRDNTGVNWASTAGPEPWVTTSTGTRCLFLLDPAYEG
jgi:hypothetical protein